MRPNIIIRVKVKLEAISAEIVGKLITSKPSVETFSFLESCLRDSEELREVLTKFLNAGTTLDEDLSGKVEDMRSNLKELESAIEEAYENEDMNEAVELCCNYIEIARKINLKCHHCEFNS